ncbi:hypothetical protein ACSQ67_024513 [Phaseolus vulgaris]
MLLLTNAVDGDAACFDYISETYSPCKNSHDANQRHRWKKQNPTLHEQLYSVSWKWNYSPFFNPRWLP